MSQNLYYELLLSPISSCIIIFSSILWFYVWNSGIDNNNFSFNYSKVIDLHQYWRMVSSVFSHFNIMHLVFNMASLWSLKIEEIQHGSLFYFKLSFYILLINNLLMISFYYILIKFGNQPQYSSINVIGYSGIIFGIMTFSSQRSSALYIQLFGLNIPYLFSPFISLFLTHLIVPQSSFLGHFSGIISGFFLFYGLMDLFDLFSDYIFGCLVFWISIYILRSLILTTNLSLYLVNYISWESEELVMICLDDDDNQSIQHPPENYNLLV